MKTGSTLERHVTFRPHILRLGATVRGRRAHNVFISALLAMCAAAIPPNAEALDFGPFSDSSAITIPAVGTGGAAGAPATPYPSTIIVGGVVGQITKVTVTLSGLSHTFPADIDALLVGPEGQKLLLMSDAGGGGDVAGVTLTFDDSAGMSVPSPMTSGTYRPTNDLTADLFPAPAPAGPYSTALSVFNGTDANGTWALYVVDDAAVDFGSIAGGWSLSFTTDAAPPTVTINTPADGASYVLGSTILADYSCASDLGIASCAGPVPSGAPIDTTTVGPKSFTVVATDVYASATEATHNYNVIWQFSNFFRKAQAGSTIPLSFSLGGNQGLNIFAPDSPSSMQVDCATGEPIGSPRKIVNPGSTTLRYRGGQYRLNWQTDAAWAGTCRVLMLDLNDGSNHAERYDFR